MAWCPRCGRYWLLRSRRLVSHGLMAYGGQPAQPPTMPCPDCWISGDEDLYPISDDEANN